MTASPEIAAYYFPQYHPDPRNDTWHGTGWTEWELVRAARPRYPGHKQPKVPTWGYFDESDPAWAAREIDLAADHGITCFIYDYYWFEDGTFLQDGLDRGFLGTPNRERLKFALMWANHDWPSVHPARYHNPLETLVPGAVSRRRFDEMADYITERYFSQPNYWTIDGAPYFSIYELDTFVHGIGGLRAAADALSGLRKRTLAAGFPGLHLNVVARGLLEPSLGASPAEITAALGISSVTSYTWAHHYPLNTRFPRDSYAAAAESNYGAWDELLASLPVPYHPNVTMGWDPSPRTVQSDVYEAHQYPWTSILEGNTPEAFRAALQRAKAFVSRPDVPQRMVTINAWNEWTEGSYLLPTEDDGTAYLEAIRDVFAR